MPADRVIRRRRLAVLAVLAFASACSDAATRVAYDIEAGTKRLESAEGARAEISHTPRSWPEGCAGSYTLQIEKGVAIDLGNGNFRISGDSGGLSVNCYGSDGRPHGWGTTYHLRFVDVPATVKVTKNGGETAVIEVERKSGRPVLVGVR